jgi:thioredoxin reductase (NADPH)
LSQFENKRRRKQLSDSSHDLVIIGGGPAGLTAGIYAARARLDVLLLEKKSPGGQVLTTEWVENYPGFPEGVEGIELIERMKKQAERFGLPIQKGEVISVNLEGPEKILTLNSGGMRCKSVIIASGAQHRKLGVEGEESLASRGVSYCATCDGAFFSDCVISVVGGGDMAVEEAIYLTKFASKVYLIHRRDELRATKILQERAFANDKIEFVWDTIVRSIDGEDLVQQVQLKNVKTHQESSLDVEAVFIFVGTYPATDFLAGAVAVDSNGFIAVNREMETSIPGVFAAGDVTGKSIRQIASGVGEGATAAVNAEKYLQAGQP